MSPDCIGLRSHYVSFLQTANSCLMGRPFNCLEKLGVFQQSLLQLFATTNHFILSEENDQRISYTKPKRECTHFTFAWYYGLTAFFYSVRNCITGLLQIPIESK